MASFVDERAHRSGLVMAESHFSAKYCVGGARYLEFEWQIADRYYEPVLFHSSYKMARGTAIPPSLGRDSTAFYPLPPSTHAVGSLPTARESEREGSWRHTPHCDVSCTRVVSAHMRGTGIKSEVRCLAASRRRRRGGGQPVPYALFSTKCAPARVVGRLGSEP